MRRQHVQASLLRNDKPMYSRKEIDEARRNLAEDPDWHRPVQQIVDEDAPFEGPGPLYVWFEDRWLSWNQWICVVPIDRDPSPPEPAPKPKKKKKEKREKYEHPTLW